MRLLGIRVATALGKETIMSPAIFGLTLVATILFPAVWYVRRDMLRTQLQVAKVQPLPVDASRARRVEEWRA